MKKLTLFILFLSFFTASLGQTINYEKGYDIEEYLSQVNISGVSVSPNGKFLSVSTAKDNYKTNKKERKLWLFDVSNLKKIKKYPINLNNKYISKTEWTKNNELYIKSSDSLGNKLFKVNPKNVVKLEIVLDRDSLLNKMNTFSIVNDNLYFNVLNTISKVKTDKNVIVLPKKPTTKHTTFYRYNLNSKKVDSLFTVEKGVVYFSFSPDEKNVIVTNSISKTYYKSDYFSEVHSYLLDATNGSIKQQITNDFVYDEYEWLNNKEIAIYFGGDTNLKHYNLLNNQLYVYDIKKKSKKHLIPEFTGEIMRYKVYNDGLLLNTTLSTSSELVYLKNLQLKKVSADKGTIANLTTNKKGVIAFSMVTNNTFEEVYLANSLDELKKPVKITNFNESLNKKDKPIIEKVVWKNEKNQTIEGVLLWPPNKKGAKNLPLIVDIHGGPWSSRSEVISRKSLQYYYFASLLASKGFLVLQPNYSGGTGRGKEFLDAINNAPLSRPSKDIISGVNFLIDKGWVNKDKMAIKGASYGGSLTNYIIGLTDMFKVAMTSCGYWNKLADFGTNDGSIANEILFKGKNIWDDLDLYYKESPISYIEKIKTPTLITHGELDVRVPTHNAYAMYYALEKMKVPVELVIYKNEGHLYQKTESKLDKVKREFDFLKKYID